MITTEVQILKKIYKKAIRQNKFLKEQIAAINCVSAWTIDRWRYDDNPMLTTATNLDLIRKFLNLPQSEILTEPKAIEAEQAGEEKHATLV